MSQPDRIGVRCMTHSYSLVHCFIVRLLILYFERRCCAIYYTLSFIYLIITRILWVLWQTHYSLFVCWIMSLILTEGRDESEWELFFFFLRTVGYYTIVYLSQYHCVSQKSKKVIPREDLFEGQTHEHRKTMNEDAEV